ncbi:MAG: hypothetical protein ACREXJ_06945 [Gammaproteobacteria bacterium]
MLFHSKRHPAEMGAPEVEAFLTHLVVQKPTRLPVVFTREEARGVLARFDGIRWVIGPSIHAPGSSGGITSTPRSCSAR